MVLGQEALQLSRKLFLLQSVPNLAEIDEDVEGVLFTAGFFHMHDVLDGFQRHEGIHDARVDHPLEVMVFHLRQHVDRGPGIGKFLEVGLEARQFLADLLELARCRALRVKANLLVELLEEPQIEFSVGDVDDLGKAWYRLTGLNGCLSHSGRRTFITNAARTISTVGGSLRDVQMLAGHRPLSTTQRYIEADVEAQKRVVDLV